MKKRKISKGMKIVITIYIIIFGLLFYKPVYVHLKSKNILDKIYYSVDKEIYTFDSNKIIGPRSFHWLNPRDSIYANSQFTYLEEALEKNERLDYTIFYHDKMIEICYRKRLEDNLFLQMQFYYYVDNKQSFLNRYVFLYAYDNDDYYILNKADTYKYLVKHNITYNSLNKKSIVITYDTIFNDWTTANLTGYSNGNYGNIIFGDINIRTSD